MSDFLEVNLPGDRRAYIEAGDIRRLLTSENSDEATIGSKDRPISIVFRDGTSLDVIGKSPLEVLTWMHIRANAAGRAVHVTFLDSEIGDG